MSASVFEPITFRMDNIRLISPLSDNKNRRTRIDKVRRALFGPVNHAEMKQFLHRELGQQVAVDSNKWDFNFHDEKPINQNAVECRFVWKTIRLTGNKLTYAPPKRKLAVEDDNSDMYANFEDIPNAAHPLRTDENNCVILDTPIESSTNKKQLKITDFMQSRKRTAESAFVKKLSTSSVPRKLSRDSHCS